MRGLIDPKPILLLPDHGLISFMGTLYTTLSEDESVDDSKWHPETAKLAVVQQRKENLQTTSDAAVTKDIFKLAAKKECRSLCHESLLQAFSNLELAFWNNPAKLASFALPMKQQRASSKSRQELGATEAFQVVQGEHPGQLIGKAKRIPKAVFYDVQMCQGYPGDESAWAIFDSYSTCSHMEFGGLTPTSRVSFRVRGRSSKSTGPWSPPFTIIVT